MKGSPITIRPHLFTRTFHKALLTLAPLAILPGVEAVVSLNTTTSQFTPLNLNGPSDPIADNQANRPDIELVGDDALGFYAFYTQFNDNPSDPGASNIDGELFFRIRVAGENGNSDGEADGYFLVGLDVTSNGTIDYFISHGGNPSQEIRILRAGASANNTPNSLSLGAELYSTDANASNSLFTEVNNIDNLDTVTEYTRQDPNNSSKTISITEDNLDGGRLTDMFLTFSLSFNALANVINNDLYGGSLIFDDQSIYQMLLVTSQNGNNLNSDLGGVDGINDTPFISPTGGGLTGPIDPTGTPVPEPGAFGLLIGLIAYSATSIKRKRA